MKLHVNELLLRQAIDRGLTAKARGNANTLSHMLLDASKAGVFLVASDGFRMCVCQLDKKRRKSEHLLLTRKAAKTLKASAKTKGGVLVDSELITPPKKECGAWPNWRRVLPVWEKTSFVAILDRIELLKRLRLLDTITDVDTHGVWFSFRDRKTLCLNVTDGDKGCSGWQTMTATTKGGRIGKPVQFNVWYFIRILKALNTRTVRFFLGDPDMPSEIRELGTDWFRYISMSIREVS